MNDETIAVDAEVIEDEGLAVSFTPAAIDANFAALDARVDELVAGYAGAVYDLSDPGAVKQAKRDRAYLNGVAKEIDERRKAVKREYMRPYEEFEARANAVAAKVKKASADIKEQLDEAEERRRDAAYAVLEEHYEAFAGLLAPVVPYERIHEEKWLNKTFGEVKAKRAVEEKVAKAAHDWKTLKAQEGMPHYETAERVFFDTLDLGAALSAAHEAQEADERIAEMRRQVEGAAFEEDADGERDKPEPAPAPCPAPAPVAAPGGEYVPCVMVIAAASHEQMRAIGRFCGGLSPRVTGRFVTGTLEQAYEKEHAGIGGFYARQ